MEIHLPNTLRLSTLNHGKDFLTTEYTEHTEKMKNQAVHVFFRNHKIHKTHKNPYKTLSVFSVYSVDPNPTKHPCEAFFRVFRGSLLSGSPFRPFRGSFLAVLSVV